MTSEPIRAAVISDTHGLLRPEVERILQSCDVVIHAGDFDHQMVFHKLKIKRPLYAVRGNNDDVWAEQLPLVRRFKLGNFRFLLVHDQADIPQDLENVQVVIFGHSHMHFQKQEQGRLWLNPGSCGYRRFTLPLSMAVLTLEEDNCQIETIFLVEEGERIRLQKEDSCFIKPGKAGKMAQGPGEESGQGNGMSGEEKQEKECLDEELPEKVRSKKEEELSEKGRLKKEEKPGIRMRIRERMADGQRQKDQLFAIAKIMRLMKRGEPVEWVAKNMKLEPVFVETIYRICVTHPQADARQILDKLEVNRLFEYR